MGLAAGSPVDLAPRGVAVDDVAGRALAAEPHHRTAVAAYGPEGQAALVESIALQRLGTPEDIAHGVLFFASNYAGWVTGQVLSIDGQER